MGGANQNNESIHPCLGRGGEPGGVGGVGVIFFMMNFVKNHDEASARSCCFWRGWGRADRGGISSCEGGKPGRATQKLVYFEPQGFWWIPWTLHGVFGVGHSQVETGRSDS